MYDGVKSGDVNRRCSFLYRLIIYSLLHTHQINNNLGGQTVHFRSRDLSWTTAGNPWLLLHLPLHPHYNVFNIMATYVVNQLIMLSYLVLGESKDLNSNICFQIYQLLEFSYTVGATNTCSVVIVLFCSTVCVKYSSQRQNISLFPLSQHIVRQYSVTDY